MWKVFGGVTLAVIVLWIGSGVVDGFSAVNKAQALCEKTVKDPQVLAYFRQHDPAGYAKYDAVCNTREMRDLMASQSHLDQSWRELKDTIKGK